LSRFEDLTIEQIRNSEPATASQSRTGDQMAKPLGVGIIGASAERGWAKLAHVPSVQRLVGLELVAIASGSQAKADAAAKVFGAKAGYADGKDLIQDPNVDIVTIAVKVPDHRELVLAALAAGKHIYCEWPLGRDLAETEELARAAQAAKVHVAIGLQTRLNPALLHARELLASGAIGRPLSARVLSTTVAFGRYVEAAMAFSEEAANGVTLATIQGAHTIDFAIALLGPWIDLNALTTTQYPEVLVGDSPATQFRSTPDHLLVQARGVGDVAVSIEVTGGRPPQAVPFRMEVTGERGDLLVEGGAMRGFQSGRLTLSLLGKPQLLDEGELASLPAEAANVAAMYAALRNDISSGTSTVPDFMHARKLAKLTGDVLSSAQTGTRNRAEGWPS
jgi:predicted dehydrogenase